jgi:arylsulfatase A-like enzyme
LPVVNPNILMVMVDQLRIPQYWLSSCQQTILDDSIAMNIAWLRKNSVQFQQCFTAATCCTPSRGALLTGLYAPQTGLLLTQTSPSTPQPDLNSSFKTFGNALQEIAGYAQANVQWLGKWHVSNFPVTSGYSDKVVGFGFNGPSQSSVKWPNLYGSPVSSVNEGSNGRFNPSPTDPLRAYVNDNQVATSFVVPTSGPWFACASFINPHDMTHYPYYFPATPGPGTLTPTATVGAAVVGTADFYPNTSNASYLTSYTACGSSSPLISALPSGFNWESQSALAGKNLAVQTWFQAQETNANGMPAVSPAIMAESQFADFLNWYFYMVGLVDVSVGTVLTSVLGSNFRTATGNPTSNTAVIFLSDHGDYGGSHGIYAKGGAVYDEAIRVPLYVMVPGQTSGTAKTYMCSLVDVFRLVVELAVGSVVNWSTLAQYVDQATRQSLFSAIYSGTSETRTIPSGPLAGTPYILTTTDELWAEVDPNERPSSQTSPVCALQNHVICLRTKSNSDNQSDLSTFYTGAKYAIYSKWALNNPPQIDSTVAQQFEFYDYTAAGAHNRSEIGNNYLASSPTTLQTQLAAALGNGPIYGVSAATGLVATELMPALGGTGYITARTAGLTAYATWFASTTGCSS